MSRTEFARENLKRLPKLYVSGPTPSACFRSSSSTTTLAAAVQLDHTKNATFTTMSTGTDTRATRGTFADRTRATGSSSSESFFLVVPKNNGGASPSAAASARSACVRSAEDGEWPSSSRPWSRQAARPRASAIPRTYSSVQATRTMKAMATTRSQSFGLIKALLVPFFVEEDEDSSESKQAASTSAATASFSRSTRTSPYSSPS
mmetsp:Transcript_33555/g.107216  ORF Transcript_33555/g.107216 Transcript_33555/m.107216 type:complete len:205 (-) Transcript_33555:1859-2473(-)